MKILFIKYAAIGDVLNATPAIRGLRHKFPFAQIDCLVGQWSAPVLQHNTNISNIIAFDEKIFTPKRIKEMLALAFRLRKEKYDISICLHRSMMIHAWTWLIGAKRRIGFINNKAASVFLTNFLVEDSYSKSRQHEILYYNEVIAPLGTNSGVEMEYFLPEPTANAKAFVATNFTLSTRKKVGMCAGGARNLVLTESRRQWFLDSYQEVIRDMPDCDFVLFGADFDRYTVEAMQKQGLKNVIDAVGSFLLSDTAYLIGKCDVFITHDTGLMHVASAMKVPQVVIFGPTSPTRRAPLNENTLLLYTHEACSPCYRPTENTFAPCNHINCLRKIKPDMVVDALRRALSGALDRQERDHR